MSTYNLGYFIGLFITPLCCAIPFALACAIILSGVLVLMKKTLTKKRNLVLILVVFLAVLILSYAFVCVLSAFGSSIRGPYSS